MGKYTYHWDEPKPLVQRWDEGAPKINEETINLLKKITVPVTTVAIVGPHRTGKSYLMNRLAGKNTGFTTGGTVEPVTKGIWAWCRPHPSKPNRCLILLDTEGLWSTDKDDMKQDVEIFILALLLSHTIIYNTKNDINQVSLNELHFVTEISEHVRAKAGPDDRQSLKKYFPKLIWVVRDFELELQINGKPCTAQDYLENALKEKPGGNPLTKGSNEVRKCLKQYFEDRECFLFPYPVKDPSNIRKIDNLSDLDLMDGFLDTLRKFCDQAVTVDIEARLSSKASVVAGLCEDYIRTIQNGQIPCIENSVATVSRIENQRAREEAFKLYRGKLHKVGGELETIEQLYKYHLEYQKEAVKQFMDESFSVWRDEYKKELAAAIQEEYQTIAKQILDRWSDQILGRIKGGNYFSEDGFKQFKSELQDLQQQFKTAENKGIKVEEIHKESSKKITNEMARLITQSMRKSYKDVYMKYKECEIERTQFIDSTTENLQKYKKYARATNIATGVGAGGLVIGAAAAGTVLMPLTLASAAVATLVATGAVLAGGGTLAGVGAQTMKFVKRKGETQKHSKTADEHRETSNELLKSVLNHNEGLSFLRQMVPKGYSDTSFKTKDMNQDAVDNYIKDIIKGIEDKAPEILDEPYLNGIKPEHSQAIKNLPEVMKMDSMKKFIKSLDLEKQELASYFKNTRNMTTYM